MVIELKLSKVGKSIGIVLPKEALARLNAGEGDTLFMTDAPDGGFRLTLKKQGKENFNKQMKAAEKVIRKYARPSANWRGNGTVLPEGVLLPRKRAAAFALTPDCCESPRLP